SSQSGGYHVWRFNLVTHTWQEMSPMQESRSFVSVTVLKGCIYAMGGYRDDGTSLRTAELHTHPSLEDTMAHLLFYSTVFLGGCFYIVGGVLRWTDPSNRVWRFNLVTHTWQEMSPMQESRSFVSVTVLKGCIYAMGGYRDDGTSLRTAERYQPNINQWTFIASMNEERIRASCTTLNNKIYICGGRSNRVLNTAEYYNPDTNQWTLITPMGTPRCDLGVVAYMGHIFAVGGRDGFRDLRHRYFDIAVMNKQIFVVSCRTGKIVECYDYTQILGLCNRVLNTAEYYNPDTNQWTLITPMGTPRCDLGVVAYMGKNKMIKHLCNTTM
uniref:Kelch-like protein n=1 Tax=Gouania willdenowi TaxID=441366 RepID=A0A8C5EVI0_GOUWI